MDYLEKYKYSEQRSLAFFFYTLLRVIDCIRVFFIFEEIEDIRSFRCNVSIIDSYRLFKFPRCYSPWTC